MDIKVTAADEDGRAVLYGCGHVVIHKLHFEGMNGCTQATLDDCVSAIPLELWRIGQDFCANCREFQ